ncbi:MAG: RcnB family protein [Caulobacteraceae bacterium]
MNRLPVSAAAIGLILAAPAALAQSDNGAANPANQTAQHAANKAARQAAKRPVRRAEARKATRPVTHRPRPVTTVRRKVTVVRKVDVTPYRRVVQAPRRYRIARPWIAPRGYAYRRYGLGQRVPTALLAASFFLPNFGLYGLQAPPYGYVWVRDGSDAVLVDRRTGEVIQAQYGLFY